MQEFIDLLKLIAVEIVPSVVLIFVLSAILFAPIILLSLKTRKLVRHYRPLWYLQTALFVIIIFGLKSIVVAYLPLDRDGLELVEKVMQTVLWLFGAFIINQILDLFVWEGAFLRKYKTPPPGLLSGLISVGLYLVAIYGVMTFVFDRPMTGLIVSSGIVAGVLGLAM